MIEWYLIPQQTLNEVPCPNASLFPSRALLSPTYELVFPKSVILFPSGVILTKGSYVKFLIPSGSLISPVDCFAEVFIFPTEFLSSAEIHMHPQQDLFSSRTSPVGCVLQAS